MMETRWMEEEWREEVEEQSDDREDDEAYKEGVMFKSLLELAREKKLDSGRMSPFVVSVGGG